jgi:hypothetical protein
MLMGCRLSKELRCQPALSAYPQGQKRDSQVSVQISARPNFDDGMATASHVPTTFTGQPVVGSTARAHARQMVPPIG